MHCELCGSTAGWKCLLESNGKLPHCLELFKNICRTLKSSTFDQINLLLPGPIFRLVFPATSLKNKHLSKRPVEKFLLPRVSVFEAFNILHSQHEMLTRAPRGRTLHWTWNSRVQKRLLKSELWNLQNLFTKQRITGIGHILSLCMYHKAPLYQKHKSIEI